MVLKSGDIKRLFIYFFYDADGIVDRYIPYMLNALKPYSTEIFVVCNGKLSNEGRKIFSNITQKILVRENKGFDVWAYKAAIDSYGWEELRKFDEVIFMNHTIMGPVFPFSELFGKMDAEDVDFWGISAYHKVMLNPFGVEYGYIPKHIQSHWIAVRSDMLKSFEFQSYWDDRPEINYYSDAVGKHEAIFTKHFADMGFTWNVYADMDEKLCNYPLMKTPVELFEKCRCPIFKRRSFFFPYFDVLCDSDGSQSSQILDYLEKNSLYDTSMIWENLLRTNNLADIKAAANLNYVLPTNEMPVISPSQKKIALVIHEYFIDLIDYCYNYALSMPSYSDIFITTDTVTKKEAIETKFSKGPWHSVKVILIENRGRDVSALLVGAAPFIMDYDLVCFMHDKKVTQLNYEIKGFYFSERCFKNLLGTSALVEQIISRFEREPHLGLLCPPPPYHADFYGSFSADWKWYSNSESVMKLKDELGLAIPLSESKDIVAPMGTMFWFRPCGMRKLFDYGWKYENFPQEPNNLNGTLLHAIERLYCYVEQDAGYYSAYVISSECARNDMTNLYYMQGQLIDKLFKLYNGSDFYGLCEQLNRQIEIKKTYVPVQTSKKSAKQVIKFLIRLFIPMLIWLPGKKIYRKFRGIIKK